MDAGRPGPAVVALGTAAVCDIVPRLRRTATNMPALVVIGGAADAGDVRSAELKRLLADAVAPLALGPREQIAIVTGGTDAGTMALVGQTVREVEERCCSTQERAALLIGVVPSNRVDLGHGARGTVASGRYALEPHHTHVLVVEGHEFGDETEAFLDLAEALSGAAPDDAPRATAALVVNGGKICMLECMACMQRGWPLVVLRGSGRAADLICAILGPDAVTPREPEQCPSGFASLVRAHRGSIAMCDMDGEAASLRASLRAALRLAAADN